MVASPIGSRISPPASISYDVAAKESLGIGSRDDRNEPVAHITAEQRTSRSDQSGAPPLGRTSSARPPKPTTTPASDASGGRSPVRHAEQHDPERDGADDQRGKPGLRRAARR